MWLELSLSYSCATLTNMKNERQYQITKEIIMNIWEISPLNLQLTSPDLINFFISDKCLLVTRFFKYKFTYISILSFLPGESRHTLVIHFYICDCDIYSPLASCEGKKEHTCTLAMGAEFGKSVSGEVISFDITFWLPLCSARSDHCNLGKSRGHITAGLASVHPTCSRDPQGSIFPW